MRMFDGMKEEEKTKTSWKHFLNIRYVIVRLEIKIFFYRFFLFILLSVQKPSTVKCDASLYLSETSESGIN